jgi:hypothetical protein
MGCHSGPSDRGPNWRHLCWSCCLPPPHSPDARLSQRLPLRPPRPTPPGPAPPPLIICRWAPPASGGAASPRPTCGAPWRASQRPSTAGPATRRWPPACPSPTCGQPACPARPAPLQLSRFDAGKPHVHGRAGALAAPAGPGTGAGRCWQPLQLAPQPTTQRPACHMHSQGCCSFSCSRGQLPPPMRRPPPPPPPLPYPQRRRLPRHGPAGAAGALLQASRLGQRPAGAGAAAAGRRQHRPRAGAAERHALCWRGRRQRCLGCGGAAGARLRRLCLGAGLAQTLCSGPLLARATGAYACAGTLLPSARSGTCASPILGVGGWGLGHQLVASPGRALGQGSRACRAQPRGSSLSSSSPPPSRRPLHLAGRRPQQRRPGSAAQAARAGCGRAAGQGPGDQCRGCGCRSCPRQPWLPNGCFGARRASGCCSCHGSCGRCRQ